MGNKQQGAVGKDTTMLNKTRTVTREMELGWPFTEKAQREHS
jgi:hypothetical protein